MKNNDLSKQINNGSNEHIIDCANDEQMVREGLRQPKLTFVWLVNYINGKAVRIGRDFSVKSAEERKMLSKLPNSVKKYKFQNNQSFHCNDEATDKLKVYVANTGLNESECNASTPDYKKRKFFKTTYSFVCSNSDINNIVKRLRDEQKLTITKMEYKGVQLNIKQYGL